MCLRYKAEISGKQQAVGASVGDIVAVSQRIAHGMNRRCTCMSQNKSGEKGAVHQLLPLLIAKRFCFQCREAGGDRADRFQSNGSDHGIATLREDAFRRMGEGVGSGVSCCACSDTHRIGRIQKC